jgi:hypothetical protein
LRRKPGLIRILEDQVTSVTASEFTLQRYIWERAFSNPHAHEVRKEKPQMPNSFADHGHASLRLALPGMLFVDPKNRHDF